MGVNYIRQNAHKLTDNEYSRSYDFMAIEKTYTGVISRAFSSLKNSLFDIFDKILCALENTMQGGKVVSVFKTYEKNKAHLLNSANKLKEQLVSNQGVGSSILNNIIHVFEDEGLEVFKPERQTLMDANISDLLETIGPVKIKGEINSKHRILDIAVLVNDIFTCCAVKPEDMLLPNVYAHKVPNNVFNKRGDISADLEHFSKGLEKLKRLNYGKLRSSKRIIELCIEHPMAAIVYTSVAAGMPNISRSKFNVDDTTKDIDDPITRFAVYFGNLEQKSELDYHDNSIKPVGFITAENQTGLFALKKHGFVHDNKDDMFFKTKLHSNSVFTRNIVQDTKLALQITNNLKQRLSDRYQSENICPVFSGNVSKAEMTYLDPHEIEEIARKNRAQVYKRRSMRFVDRMAHDAYTKVFNMLGDTKALFANLFFNNRNTKALDQKGSMPIEIFGAPLFYNDRNEKKHLPIQENVDGISVNNDIIKMNLHRFVLSIKDIANRPVTDKVLDSYQNELDIFKKFYGVSKTDIINSRITLLDFLEIASLGEGIGLQFTEELKPSVSAIESIIASAVKQRNQAKLRAKNMAQNKFIPSLAKRSEFQIKRDEEDIDLLEITDLEDLTDPIMSEDDISLYHRMRGTHVSELMSDFVKKMSLKVMRRHDDFVDALNDKIRKVNFELSSDTLNTCEKLKLLSQKRRYTNILNGILSSDNMGTAMDHLVTSFPIQTIFVCHEVLEIIESQATVKELEVIEELEEEAEELGELDKTRIMAENKVTYKVDDLKEIDEVDELD